MSSVAENKLLTRIHLARRDIGNLLFHFTRSVSVGDNFVEQKKPASAGDVLATILRERKLRGSSAYIKGGHKCICFTEAPISEAAALFQLAKIAADSSERPKYEPYGIAVTKEWLFARGGRHAIYQSDSEYAKLDRGMQYRHVRYEPGAGIDYTWEREWRVCADELELDALQTLVVVPTSQQAFDLMYRHSSWEADFDRDGEPVAAYPVPEWMVVSLDFFGLV